jgi:hypothetical protein
MVKDASGHIVGRYDGVVRIDWLAYWFSFSGSESNHKKSSENHSSDFVYKK